MINKNLSSFKNKKDFDVILKIFIDNFWFSPQDAILRASERLIWAKREFKKPVLDIGIADAGVSKFLFKGIQKIDIGIDVDEKNIKIAASSKFYKQALIGDARKMQFKNNYFGTVISNSTFEHINKDLQAVSEVARVLKKGGNFYLTVPDQELEKYLRKLGVNKKAIKKYNSRVEHFHYRTFADWQKIFKKNNLKIIYSAKYFPFELFRVWYMFHRLMVSRPYKREFWSYLRDSPLVRIVPKKFFKRILFKISKKHFYRALEPGCWHFFILEKM